MKTVIKTLAVAAALVIAFALFCGCGRKTGNGDSTAAPSSDMITSTLPSNAGDEETEKNDGKITDVSEEGSNGAAGELLSDAGEMISDVADGVSEGISNAAER